MDSVQVEGIRWMMDLGALNADYIPGHKLMSTFLGLMLSKMMYSIKKVLVIDFWTLNDSFLIKDDK